MRVILVEDNLLVRQLEADILGDSGHEVATTASAEEALQLLDERAATLITNIRLPGGMDGIALARSARQRRPDLAIMLVAADIDNLALPDLDGIADVVLGKPFTVAEFEQCVAGLAKRIEVRAAVRGTPSDKPNPIASKEATDEHAQIKRWRLKAEVLRTAADQFAVPSGQESLRRAAANYERLADVPGKTPWHVARVERKK